MNLPISRGLLVALLSVSLVCPLLFAQQPTQRGQQTSSQGMGTVSTGESRTDASKRTAGITDPKAPAVFEDVTAKTALASFRHRADTTSKDYIIDAPSGGVTILDFDGDGRLDAVMNNCDAPPALLRNVAEPKNHWLALQLVGDPSMKSPRDATGAIVYLTAGGTRRRLDVVSGGSFGSQNDARLHFGLGSSTHIDALEIRWPGGATQQIVVSGIDRVLTIKQGRGTL